jgi:lipid-binding SYLF domain-containing protein
MPLLQRRRLAALLAAGGTASMLTAAVRPAAAAATSRRQINDEVAAAMARLRKIEKVQPLLQHAKATLVFPHIISGGFIVGGQYGEGAALGANGTTQGYYSIGGVSLGFLAGAQSAGLAMFFMTEEALAALMRAEGWEIGTGPSVVVIDKGAQVNVTATTLREAVYAITFDQEGLMASLALNGTKISRITPEA